MNGLLCCRFVRYGLKHGNNETFTFMLGAYGLMLTFAFPRSAAGTRLTNIAFGLTSRETEILYTLSEGLSIKEIAFRFGITEATVKSHVFRLYGKLQVKRRGQAIARARELQLME
ncbi:response regulator transcription factor [Cohnella silvisoli]|uniref:LuxR C-terminal-related transcriptional regulator n=1 Tax=Cohnella silvisoli TaxID=2873699 RepID=A0ABV1L6H0_9BACL|nr:LuxR C-terminal-related transcriptional regulator [Cohnella silvisoli]MCD9026408.1 LuxR C-terminal-related transcriptional regulator [Cohnella silvisoli]